MEPGGTQRERVGRARALGAVLATPRWVGWTVLAVCAVTVCAVMAHWQFVRAESPAGSLLNAGYAVQWPVFGVFFAALWWRMLSAEARLLDEITPGGPGGPDQDRATPVPGAGADPAAEAVPASPFTPRPAGVRPGEGQGDPVRVRARTDYNAMLAALARSDENRRET